MPEQRIVIIAGPNGAGKTTFAREFLPKYAGIIPFINADGDCACPRRGEFMSIDNDPDLKHVMAALIDAGKAARAQARMLKQCVVFMRDNKLVFEFWDGFELVKDIPLDPDFDPMKAREAIAPTTPSTSPER